MVDPSLFQNIEDLREWYPGVGFSGADIFQVEDRGLIVIDPIYLADVYNTNDDENADYIRHHSVIVSDIGGDSSCPIWWREPFLILPLDQSSYGDSQEPVVAVLSEEICCDSGSFAFLPLLKNLPNSLAAQIDVLVAEDSATICSLPTGSYKVFYEQRETPHGSYPSFHRNVIAQRQ